MKKILALAIVTLSILFVAQHAQAQSLKTFTLSKTTLSATDTGYVVTALDDYTQSIYYKFTKNSGTPTGYFIISGSNDGSNWDALDTLTITGNGAFKTKDMGKLIYNSYRVRAITTSTTQNITIAAYYLRRTSKPN